ncbi:hypothetical protein ACGF07_34860 [Kitasatospora sp. NPDC048194]|uniref:hypothetical protein n=1 Tax=Kitasatospora sp. NPDC048194 TaxID=3364045 RepID=UPI0037188171
MSFAPLKLTTPGQGRGAPLYLLAGRQLRTCTLFSEPHDFGYAVVDGPHPFAAMLRLPEPFNLTLDTRSF